MRVETERDAVSLTLESGCANCRQDFIVKLIEDAQAA
jgi:hypothetical protein